MSKHKICEAKGLVFGVDISLIGYKHTVLINSIMDTCSIELNGHIVYYCPHLKIFRTPLPLSSVLTIKDTYDTIIMFLEKNKKYHLLCEIHNDELIEKLQSSSVLSVGRNKNGSYRMYPDKFDFELKGKKYKQWRKEVNHAKELVGLVVTESGEKCQSDVVRAHYDVWFEQFVKRHNYPPFERPRLDDIIFNYPKSENLCFSIVYYNKMREVLMSCLISVFSSNGKAITSGIVVQNTKTELGQIGSFASRYLMYSDIKKMLDERGLEWLCHDVGGEEPSSSISEFKRMSGCVWEDKFFDVKLKEAK